MHIMNAVLDPKVAGTTALLGGLGLAYGLRKLNRQLGERTTVLMGTMAAFIFAAQMVNFPLGPLGISGHLLGGVLSAVMLGPWAGAVVIAAVLIVQCLIFGDGGLTALGANFVNMGLLGAVGGYAIYDPIRRALGGWRGILIGAMLAAWFSVLLAAGAFALELAFSGRFRDFPRILTWMALVHSVIGVGEAVITGFVLRFILLTRPDLVYNPEESVVSEASAFGYRTVLGGLAIALAVAVFLAPLASEHPDGLEYVGQSLGFLPEGEPEPTVPTPIPDYTMPGVASPGLATALAGLAGTLLVFGLAMALANIAPARLKKPTSPELLEWPGGAGDAA